MSLINIASPISLDEKSPDIRLRELSRLILPPSAVSVSAVAAELDQLPPQIPEIAVYRHGRDLGINEGNFDYVVVADFATADDYVVYRDHPVHQSMIQRMIAGRVAQRAAVQYTFEA